ncbi:plasmid stabilization protein [Nocardia asteroides]|uniref:plasmid stabilization protein n=1 Tax=Nocardia asteroides TaxID=1824 RepID=UPI001E656F66|nr:plasmid stabilization protein [Nocardia asteroides]UGT54284.1 plasmid stabilization protein [Nocardia asteroides]
MPQQAWSDKRERQYKHIKESQREKGVGEDRAEEIAARTVNKNRAQSGESKRSSKLSRTDTSPQRRGGQRAHRKGPRGLTRDQLYEEARRRNIDGRSKMNKQELAHALGRD